MTLIHGEVSVDRRASYRQIKRKRTHRLAPHVAKQEFFAWRKPANHSVAADDPVKCGCKSWFFVPVHNAGWRGS